MKGIITKGIIVLLSGVAAIVLAVSAASAVTIVDMNFDGTTGLENAGVGPDGTLEAGASIGATAGQGGSGGLVTDGTEQGGLNLDIGTFGTFSGSGDFSVSFDFKSNVVDAPSGSIFTAEGASFLDESGLELPGGQEASLTMSFNAEEIFLDVWFLGGIGVPGTFNDGAWHTVNLAYDSIGQILSLSSPSAPGEVAEFDFSEEEVPFAMGGRDTTNDITRLGAATNPDLVEDETGIPCDCTFDNLLIDGPSPPPVKLLVDRATGDMDLEVIAGDPTTIDSVQILSGNGTLVANNYDGLGASGGSFADWAVDSGDEFEISESGTAATVANTDGPFTLGSGVWAPFFDEDVRVLVFDTALGENVPGITEYVGDPKLFADLDDDGDIDAIDFGLFRDGFGTDVEGLSFFEAYFLADLNGDEIHNLDDWALFAGAYDEFNGGGAFAALLSVPEPAAIGLLLVGAASALAMRRRRLIVAAAVLALFGIAGAESVYAVVEVEYLFDSNNFDDTSGNGRTGIPRPDQTFGPFAQNQVLNLTGGFEEALEAPIPADTLAGLSSYTIEVDINTSGNSFFPDAGVIVASSTNSSDPIGDPEGSNNSMAIFIEPQEEILDEGGVGTGEFEGGALVLDYFFIGEVRVPEALLLDGNDHSLIISYEAPADPGDPEDPNPGAVFLSVDGEWRGIGELAPRPAQSHDLVQFGTTANADFPFECFEGECFTAEFEGTMDNIRIKTGADTVIPTLLRAEADGTTGQVTILGGEFSRDVRYIEVNSESNAINDGQWNSFSDQNLDPVDDGADLGETWEELNAAKNQLAEAFLLGSSTFSDTTNSSVSLGNIYNPIRGAEDLEIFVALPDGEPVFVEVEYVNPNLIGDFDDNLTVEVADLDQWKGDYGLNADSDDSGDGASGGDDFLGWQANLGASVATVAAIPEPSAAALLVLCGGSLLVGRARCFGSR